MIRFWEKRDSIQLRKLIATYIESQDPFGGQILPVKENIDWFLQLGYEQVALGQPHLVYEEDRKILAYIQMGECISALKLRDKTIEIFAMFTVPEVRRRFLSIELLREAGKIIAKLGFTRGISSVLISNEKMWKNMFYNPAIWPTRIFFEWRIDCDPQVENGELVNFVERKAS